MAFEYELTTLDGVDEATAKEYIKVGDVYRLDLKGGPDVTGLKNTVEATRKERDALSLQLKESTDAKAAIDAEKIEAERLRLVEKGEFKTLHEASQKKELETAAELSDLKGEISAGERKAMATEITSGLSDDVEVSAVLMEQALKYIESGESGHTITGGHADGEALRAHLQAKYPSLCKGSQSGGGGSQGGGGGNPTGKRLGDYNDQELKALRANNKPEYDRVMKEGY